MGKGVLCLSALALGIEGHLDFEFSLPVLGDGEECFTVVE